MKKEKRKVQILRRMTEGDIKGLGGNMWMRRRVKGLIVLAALAFVWLFVGTVIFDGWFAVLVAMPPIAVLYMWWAIRYTLEGKKLWNYVKDKEQPVDLG